MKVLWITHKGYPVMGGAQITNLAFLKNLSRHYRHECRMLCQYPYRKDLYYGEVSLATFRDYHELDAMTRAFKPDVLISGMDASHEAVKIAGKYNIPSVVYLHSFEYSPPCAAERELWGVSGSREYAGRTLAEFIFRNADARVANSLYMKKRFERDYKPYFSVLYPEILSEDCLLADGRDENAAYITGVCGFPYKGSRIFYDLARELSNERFLLAGNASHTVLREFEKLENVKVLPYTPLKSLLKASKVVLVPSQWPEPFGRMAVEAMANGIPTLASLTGGMAEIVSGTGIGVRNFRDSRAWARKLAEILTSAGAMELNSKEGIMRSRKFLAGRPTHQLNGLITRLARKKKPDFKRGKVVALTGDYVQKTAYASVNSRWARLLEGSGRFRVLKLRDPSEPAPLNIDCFIHHDYGEDFSRLELPGEGKLIAVRTWDFGRFPKRWVEKINSECDQLWVHSAWVRRNAVRSGIPAKRVKVIPHGIDENVFRPDGGKYELETNKSFKFLFAGATVFRKGIDILLKAYGAAFNSRDDVCLVIKDNPRDVFYKGIKSRDEILRARGDGDYPEVIYIDEYLGTEELASLYRACDAGVFPYRAEGFCMPILEAMACGLPSIVPGFGACLDFCSRSESFLMPCRRISLPVTGKFMINTLGFTEEVEEVDFCEVSPETLASYMKRAASMSRKALEQKSLSGVRKAHGRFKWSDAGALIGGCIDGLDTKSVPVRLRRARSERLKHRKRYEAAKKMFLTGKGGRGSDE